MGRFLCGRLPSRFYRCFFFFFLSLYSAAHVLKVERKEIG